MAEWWHHRSNQTIDFILERISFYPKKDLPMRSLLKAEVGVAEVVVVLDVEHPEGEEEEGGEALQVDLAEVEVAEDVEALEAHSEVLVSVEAEAEEGGGSNCVQVFLSIFWSGLHSYA
jgi:FixJ family two-component response regulator